MEGDEKIWIKRMVEILEICRLECCKVDTPVMSKDSTAETGSEEFKLERGTNHLSRGWQGHFQEVILHKCIARRMPRQNEGQEWIIFEEGPITSLEATKPTRANPSFTTSDQD